MNSRMFSLDNSGTIRPDQGECPAFLALDLRCAIQIFVGHNPPLRYIVQATLDSLNKPAAFRKKIKFGR